MLRTLPSHLSIWIWAWSLAFHVQYVRSTNTSVSPLRILIVFTFCFAASSMYLTKEISASTCLTTSLLYSLSWHLVKYYMCKVTGRAWTCLQCSSLWFLIEEVLIKAQCSTQWSWAFTCQLLSLMLLSTDSFILIKNDKLFSSSVICCNTLSNICYLSNSSNWPPYMVQHLATINKHNICIRRVLLGDAQVLADKDRPVSFV